MYQQGRYFQTRKEQEQSADTTSSYATILSYSDVVTFKRMNWFRGASASVKALSTL